MNRTPLTLLSVATFSTFALLSTSALSATKIGVVSAADPSVRIVGVDGAERQVKLGDDIFADDTIKTDAKGQAQLMFEDRSTITVKENSEIKIDHFIYDPNSDSGEMGMKSVKGAFRFIGGALSKQKPVTIKTPVATIGIRGGIVDTNVAPNGATNAVFVYGKEMSITNGNGQRSVTTDYGTGFTLNAANVPPVAMPAAAVQTVMNGFVNTTSQGGGAPVTPTPQSIAPQLNLGTDARAPEPLGAGNGGAVPSTPEGGTAPAVPTSPTSENGGTGTASATTPATGTQAPAPILLVEGTSVSALDVAALSGNVDTQTQDGVLQSAVTDPNTLQALVSSGSLQTQLANNAGLQEFLGAPPTAPTGAPTAPTTTLTPLPTNPTAPVAPVTNIAPPPPASTGGGGAAPETFTAVTGRAGRFMVLSDTVGGGGYEILNRGEVTVTEESATSYKITFVSAIAQPTRSFTVPKLTATGLTQGGSVAIADGSTTTIYDRAGYKTQNGSMEVYALNKSGAPANAPDKEINFVVGQHIFSSAHTGLTDVQKFQNAAARSVTASNAGGSSVHGVQTDGVLLYDFTPELGTGDSAKFGNFKHNRIAGVNDMPAQNAPFGMAIDWNSGRQGNAFSGQVNWLPVNGKSGATGSFGSASGSVNSANPENIAGKRLAYMAEAVGAANSGAGKADFGAFAMGGELFGTPTGVVEGGVIRYVTPNAAQDPSQIASTMLGLSDANLINQGTQAIALKHGITADLGAQVTAADTDTIYKGFASGIVMQHNGTNYVPTVLSNNASETAQVVIDPTGTGNVLGNIQIKDYNTNGAGGGTNYKSATFGNTNNNVYINRNLYTAQSTTISHDGYNPASQHGSFVVGAGAINNVTNTLDTDYRCTNCQFTHWGVWAGDIGKNNAGRPDSDQANMIPYVVGSITQNAGSLGTSTATYKGPAYATVHKTGINPKNIAGKMDATANLGAGAAITDFRLDFGSVEGADLKLQKVPTNPAITPSGNAVFTSELQAQGASPTDAAGRVNGALFGATGQEIGGNYVFERTTDDLKGGGIFMGKQ